MYTAGFVILTLVINAPIAAPLMTLLKLSDVSDEQVLMRNHVSGSGGWTTQGSRFIIATAVCVAASISPSMTWV
jgi:hypothetical protein